MFTPLNWFVKRSVGWPFCCTCFVNHLSKCVKKGGKGEGREEGREEGGRGGGRGGGRADRFLDGPVWEPEGVTEVTEVVDVTEQLVFQLLVPHHRHGTVLDTPGNTNGRLGEWKHGIIITSDTNAVDTKQNTNTPNGYSEILYLRIPGVCM